jgi:hypothetical protein
VGKTYAGGNINNATRNALFKLYDRAGWSPEETAAIDCAITGGPVDNLLRLIGRGLAPTHGGMTATRTPGAGPAAGGILGAMVGHPAEGMALGFVPDFVGEAAKRGADYITARRFQNIRDMSAKRSPLFQNRPRTEGANFDPTIANVLRQAYEPD